jgi:hypothetical protein
MCEIMLAEMVRYASSGFKAAPDAMAANWELAWLCDSGALRVKDGVLHPDRSKFPGAVASLLSALSATCLREQLDGARRLTTALAPLPELTQLVEAAGAIDCLQIYSTST